MMINLGENKERPQMQPGSNYVGQLMRIESHPTPEEVAQNKIPQFGPYLTFVFKIVSPAEFATAYISGICSAKRHPKSKLTQWLQALGVDITQVAENLDEASLVGKQVRLRVEKGANERMKITAMGSMSGPVPVAQTTPLGIKPASRPAPGTGIVGTPVVHQAPATFGAGVPVVPTLGSSGGSGASSPFNTQDLDDVPF